MEVINVRVGKKDGAPSKMVEIRIQMEGTGPNLSTNFVNMDEVAEAMGRLAWYIIKYIGVEVDALSRVNDERRIFRVRRAHDAATLARVINKFIETYVECYTCGHPGTELVMNEEAWAVSLVCGDCGSTSEVKRPHMLFEHIVKYKNIQAEKRLQLQI